MENAELRRKTLQPTLVKRASGVRYTQAEAKPDPLDAFLPKSL